MEKKTDAPLEWASAEAFSPAPSASAKREDKCDDYEKLVNKVPYRQPDRGIVMAQRKSLLDSIDNKDIMAFLPHFVQFCEIEELQSITTRLTGYSVYELYYCISYIRGSSAGHEVIPSSLRRDILKPISIIYSWAEKMFLETKTTPYPTGSELTNFIEFMNHVFRPTSVSAQTKVKVRSISIVECYNIVIKIDSSLTGPAGDTVEHLLFDSGTYTAYIISKGFFVIGKLTHIEVICPRILLGQKSVAVLELPPGAIIGDFWKEIREPKFAIEPFAVHVAFSYLFGLDGKYLGYAPQSRGLFHLTFSKFYVKDRMRLGKIIAILGGRNSPHYKQFVLVAIRYCMMIRVHAKVARLFLRLLKAKEEDITSRFALNLTDEEAEAFYKKKLTESGDTVMRAWTYLGY